MGNFDKDLDTFPSTYAKDFRWLKDGKPSKSYKDLDCYALSEEEAQKYLLLSEINKIQFKELSKNFIQRLMKSDYSSSYCKDYHPMLRPEDEGRAFKDVLFENENKLYGPKKEKVMPPLPTARRVLGYMPEKDQHTGLTEYQETIARVGYLKSKEKADRKIQPLPPPEPE